MPPAGVPPAGQRQAAAPNGIKGPASARAPGAQQQPGVKGPSTARSGGAQPAAAAPSRAPAPLPPPAKSVPAPAAVKASPVKDVETGGRFSSMPVPQQLPAPNVVYPEYSMQQPLVPRSPSPNGGYYAGEYGYPPSSPTPMVTYTSGAPGSSLGCCSMMAVAGVSAFFGYIGGQLGSSDIGGGKHIGTLLTNSTAAVGGLVSPAFSVLSAELDDVGCPAGLLIPAIGRSWMNAIIYLLLLFWSFLGVALGADVFMMAIEFITSAEKIIKVDVDGGKRSFSVLVWNPTIANLTLMALGSSAPEILLSIIEVVSNNFYAGELGPSTIVGSAAFNLMVISAVCVMSIPDGETRRIKELPVFYITASFSIFAYLWLLYILLITSPNIVEVWEGVVTFALFGVLCGLAYMADIKAGCFGEPRPEGEGNKIVAISREGKPVTANDVSRAVKLVKENVSADEYAEAVRDLLSGPKSKAHHKLNNSGASDMLGAGSTKKKAGAGGSKFDPGMIAQAEAGMKLAPRGTTLSLESDRLLLPPNQKFVELMVLRSGNLAVPCSVSWTVATMPDGQVKLNGSLAFDKYQERKFVRVNRAALPPNAPGCAVVLTETSSNSQLGLVPRCDVDMGGKTMEKGSGLITFESDQLIAKESMKNVIIVILRKGGNSAEVSVDVKTVEDTATAGSDFLAVDTTVTFAPGEQRKEIAIDIMDDGKYERDEMFLVTLSNPTGGAEIAGAAGDGGDAKAICEVTIESDEEERSTVDQVLAVINFDVDAARLGGSDWCEQFAEAVEFPEEGNFAMNAFTYLLSLPFNIVFALPPPPRVMGGWACFCCALALIGALTALIGDLANHVGCCFGIPATTTAITLVALGTSLPDTFASMTAAKQEPYADASIGNITGSNSVNVFLGLGLPWMIAAFYWAAADDEKQAEWRARFASEPWYTPDMPVGFAVPAGSLGTSVAIFSVCAVLTLGTLMLRRAREGFELGGAGVSKNIVAIWFVCLWMVYIALSIMLG